MQRTRSCQPTSTRVHESAVIAASVDNVWGAVRSLDFKFSSNIASVAAICGSASEVGSVHEIKYKDGSSWTIRLLELSDLHRTLTYEVVAAEPPMEVMSTVHTISLRRITTTNQTFIEWQTDYSSDADTVVIEDQKYKQREAFADLSRALAA